MVIICKDTEPLHKERIALMRKLDKNSNYPEDEEQRKIEMQRDEIRLGEVELEIKKVIARYIEQAMDKVKEQSVETLKEFSPKELKKMLHNKYASYKELALMSRELYGQLVERKKEGAALDKAFRENTMTSEQLKEEILRY